MTKTTPAKKATAAKKTTKAATPAKPAAAKPISTAFNRSSLITHLAELAAVELKAVRAVPADTDFNTGPQPPQLPSPARLSYPISDIDQVHGRP